MWQFATEVKPEQIESTRANVSKDKEELDDVQMIQSLTQPKYKQLQTLYHRLNTLPPEVYPKLKPDGEQTIDYDIQFNYLD